MSTTIGVFNDRVNAENAIMELRKLGVTDTDISYVMPETQGTKTAAGEASKGIAGGVTAGGVIGALAGLAVANGILPGLGTLFVAGPLATALGLTGIAATTAAGAMTGAAAGGLIGALRGLGVNDKDAATYEGYVKRGGILLAVRSTFTNIANVLKKYHAQEIREYPAT